MEANSLKKHNSRPELRVCVIFFETCLALTETGSWVFTSGKNMSLPKMS